MPHLNTVFSQLTQHINWDVFNDLVDKHGTDYRTRRCSSRSQFLAILYGQLSGASSLREIELGLKSHKNCLYHAGAKLVARSTLSDANSSRSWRLFADMFIHMVQSGGRRSRRALGEGIRILDASVIKLNGLSADWARFSKDSIAAKLHVVYDPETDCPVRADITRCNVNDIKAAELLDIKPGKTYVFDLAYYSYSWWAEIVKTGARFVTRLKSHTRLREVYEQPIDRTQNTVLYDKIGYLPQRLARSRRNPMDMPVREIGVRLETGKTIRIVSNDIESSAMQIAELYKTRWKIELFFKWIKQNLKIKHFIGTSENAIKIQIYVALIAFLILRQAQRHQKSVKRTIAFTRLVRINLMHRRSINHLIQPEQPPPETSKQMRLNLEKSLTGQ